MRWLLLLPAVLLSVGCYAPDPDWPWFVDADAWCEDQDWFDLWAEVDHERGPRAVTAVWVDVGFVSYEPDDTIVVDWFGGWDLEYQAEGQWAAAVQTGTSPLECEYEYEYYFLFTAEDDGGQTVQTDLIN